MSETLARFRRMATRSRYEESLEPAWWNPFSVYLGKSKPRRLLFFTKDILCRSWWQPLPGDVVALVHYGIPTALHFQMVEGWLARMGGPIHFVGDLDPMDLTVFAALRAGDPLLRAPRRRRLPVRYAGIDEGWLELCRRWMRRGLARDTGTIAMPPLEREHLQLVRGLLPDIEALIGSRGVELLESGYKLELEGASNPALYRRSFTAELRRYVLGRCRHAR